MIIEPAASPKDFIIALRDKYAERDKLIHSAEWINLSYSKNEAILKRLEFLRKRNHRHHKKTKIVSIFPLRCLFYNNSRLFIG